MLADADEVIEREDRSRLRRAAARRHVKMLALVEATNREGVDVTSSPTCCSSLTRAVENLDGVPIISLNDVPRAFNSVLKRTIDVISSSALLTLTIPFLIIAALIRAPRPVRCSTPRSAWASTAGVPGLKFRSVNRRGRRDRSGLGARQRPALHAVRRWLRKLGDRRTAAAVQRAARRHVDRRAAAGRRISSTS
jgi:hypothetical protein